MKQMGFSEFSKWIKKERNVMVHTCSKSFVIKCYCRTTKKSRAKELLAVVTEYSQILCRAEHKKSLSCTLT